MLQQLLVTLVILLVLLLLLKYISIENQLESPPGGFTCPSSLSLYTIYYCPFMGNATSACTSLLVVNLV
jgi:hypothetical protein